MVIKLLIFSPAHIHTVSFLPCFVLLARQLLVCKERECVCSACQSLHSSHLPYAPWMCAHLQLVVQDVTWLDGTDTMPVKGDRGANYWNINFHSALCDNHSRISVGFKLAMSVSSVNYTTIITFMCNILGMLSESTRSVFIVADDKQTSSCIQL